MTDVGSPDTGASASASGPVAALPRTGTPTPVMATPVFWMEDVLGAMAGDGLLGRIEEAVRHGARNGVSPGSSEGPLLRVEAPELAEALARVTPFAQQLLGTDELAGSVEYAMIVHEGGQHTALRTDAGPGGSAYGPVAFDYFLHRRPSRFSGGELRIFDVCVRDGREECARTFRDIYPDHDTMVVYPAAAWYEVRMVQCPSGLTEDGRFAFHGWIS